MFEHKSHDLAMTPLQFESVSDRRLDAERESQPVAAHGHLENLCGRVTFILIQ